MWEVLLYKGYFVKNKILLTLKAYFYIIRQVLVKLTSKTDFHVGHLSSGHLIP